MIIAGDWAITPGIRVLPDGAVSFDGSRIRAVGTREELVHRFPDAVVRDHPGCVIMPGLVNAHTHLALTALKDTVGPTRDFIEWLDKITQAILALDRDDLAASTALGALQCLQNGVTTVGDIAYGPESPAAAGDAGLGGVFCWEALGITPAELPDVLTRIEFPSKPDLQCPTRMHCGLTPHSPYTSGPDLLRAMKRICDELSVPYVIHAAESVPEMMLMTAGGGPLAERATRLAHGFHTPRSGSIRYLNRLGVLDDSIIIHAVHLMPGEAELLARKARGVVLCPRSNQALGNGKPPVGKLISAGVKLALGTDSAASNRNLDLFAEARMLRELYPDVSGHRLIAMMTEEGADVLGVSDKFGRLAPGYSADVIAVEVGETGHPVRALIDKASGSKVKTVITGGVARVLGGVSTVLTDSIVEAAARVTAKATRAVMVR